MRRHLKKISAYIALLAVFCSFLSGCGPTGLNFNSGLRLTTEYGEQDLDKVELSPEVAFYNSIVNDEWSETDHYGNYALTKEDLQVLFEQILRNNGDVQEATELAGISELIGVQNKHGVYHATRVYFQYYWETWCVYSFDKWDPSAGNTNPETGEAEGAYVEYKTPLDSEWDEEYCIANFTIDGHEPQNFEWGWHCGYRPKDSELNDYDPSLAGDQLFSNDEKHPFVLLDNRPRTEGSREVQYTDELNPRYKIAWQPAYALAQMAGTTNVEHWIEGTEGDSVEEEADGEEKEDSGKYKIIRRLNDGDIDKIIEIFTIKLVWGYDGAWDSSKSGYDQSLTYKPYFGAVITTDYSRWNDQETGNKTYKWDQIDKLSYTIEREGDWGKRENGRQLYKRRLYKIPATSLLSASNGYESWTYYGTEVTNEGATIADGAGAISEEARPDAVVDSSSPDRQKYAFYERFLSDDGTGYEPSKYKDSLYDCGPGPKTTNLNDEHGSDCPCYTCGGNQHALAVAGGEYECNAMLLQKEMEKVVKEPFNWNKFITILQTLPETEDMVKRYKKIAKACEKAEDTGNDEDGHIKEPLEEDEFIIDRFVFESPSGAGKKIFVGKGDEKSSSKLAGGKMVIPDVAEDWDEDVEVDSTLRVNHDFSVEQIQYLFSTLSGYLSRPDSLIASTPGMAEALVQFQNDSASMGKPVDLVGLLAIANTESAYGTSDICRRKWNFIGWGAVDWNPGGEAWTFKDAGVCAALVKNFELIRDNYIYGRYDQDTYYKMRYNNNVHQYCTSTTWPSTNAIGRQQMLKLLGVQTDERKIENWMTEEQNYRLEQYQKEGFTYYSKGSMFPPCDYRNISSPYGFRGDIGIKGASTYHRGIDIPGAEGSCIRSAITGYVSHVGDIRGGGYAIYVTGGAPGEGGEEQHLVTKYMHMIEGSAKVKVGDIVEAGQEIGLMGHTGVGSGTHLHFAIDLNGESVDPLPFLYGSWQIVKKGKEATWTDGQQVQ